MQAKFLEAFSEALQVEPAELTGDFALSWDSLLIVAAMSMISEFYERTVDVEALLQCGTIGELLRLIDASGESRLAA
ncbi:MAG TPA: phosphopantetheine-binding protein [Planctomycetaceae bacterium]|nr:phosphopantetheine-binding protein [Planctomycetaceae bacterium]